MLNTQHIPQIGYVRLETVLQWIPVSKSYWYASVAAGLFPKPVKLGPRMAAYRVEDIKALIERLGSADNEQTTDM